MGGGDKRSAGYQPEGEPVTKAAARDLTITVHYATSGELLKTVTMSSNATVEGLKAILNDGLEGRVVQQLLKENDPLLDDKTLEACDITNGVVLKAVLQEAFPVLYISEPCTFTEFSKRGDGWIIRCGDGDLQGMVDEEEHGRHADIAYVPADAKEVVAAMHDAAPGLSNIPICQSSDCDDGGQIIVIGHPGPDPKKACLKALHIRKMVNDDSISQKTDPTDPEMSGVWSLATLEPRDMKARLHKGFNCDEWDEDEDGDEDEVNNEILALTGIMNDKLQKHFVFNFNDEVANAPMVYGGYTSDGSIVGVLTSRMWS